MSDLLNAPRLQELIDDFGPEAADVIGEFVAETDGGVADLESLLAEAPVDTAAVQAGAHKIKGGCMLVGAQALQQLVTELDALGRQDAEGAELQESGRDLGDVWARTRAALLQAT